MLKGYSVKPLMKARRKIRIPSLRKKLMLMISIRKLNNILKEKEREMIKLL